MDYVSFAVLSSMDPSLGRVDKSMLSDQDLLELLFDNLTEESKETIRKYNEQFHSVCSWDGVWCDAKRRVIKFHPAVFFTGSMSFDYIPPNVTHFVVVSRSLSGTLDAHVLSQVLEKFNIRDNNFEGAIPLDDLPASLSFMDLSENAFEGSCDLTRLPQKMKELLLRGNECTGSVDLQALPSTMQTLDIGENRFFGKVCLEKLPRRMQMLFLDGNAFCGDFKIVNPPWCLQGIRAFSNNFAGIAVVHSGIASTVMLHGNAITAVVDEDGNILQKFDRN